MKWIWLLLLAFLQAVPPATAQDYGSLPILDSGSVCGAGGKCFNEDCSSISDWDNLTSPGSATWVVDAGTCRAESSGAFDLAVMVQTSDTTSVFCSFVASCCNDAPTTYTNHGCVLRATGSPGDWYQMDFSNSGDRWILRLMNNSHTEASRIETGFGGGGDDCGCTWAGDVIPGDYIGVTLVGTAANNDRVLNIYDFGATPPSDQSIPATWGSVTCSCSEANFDSSGLGSRDTAGGCGPTGRGTSDTDTLEPRIDDFYCGDF
jgi:hypothetical protein